MSVLNSVNHHRTSMATQLTKVVKFDPIIIESKFKWEIRQWTDLKETGIESSRIEIPEIGAFWWITILPKLSPPKAKVGADNVHKTVFNFNLRMRSESWKKSKYEYEVQCVEPKRNSRDQLNVFSIHNKPIDQALMVTTEETQMNIVSSSCSAFNSKTFVIKVTIKFLGSSVIRSRSYDPCAADKDILTNVRGLFGNSTFADFTFIVKDKEFKVHRNILAASSSVMHKMFTTNMEESRTNRCKIDHVEPDVFEKFLECIYKGSFPDDFGDYARELYSVADYYGIDRLKEVSRSEVAERLDASNAAETYKWACQYDLEDLKADAWEIVKR